MADRRGYEDAVIERISAQVDPLAEAMADAMGLPPGGKTYTQDDIDAEWSFSPLASPEERVTAMLQLKQLGKTDEEITDLVYPNRRRLVEASHPGPAERIKFAKAQDARMQKLAAAMTPPPVEPMPPPAPMTAPAPAAPSILDRPLNLAMGG